MATPICHAAYLCSSAHEKPSFRAAPSLSNGELWEAPPYSTRGSHRGRHYCGLQLGRKILLE